MAKRYLTLDIGASSVKLAEYEGGRGGLTLVNYGIAALAAPLDSGNADAILSPATARARSRASRLIRSRLRRRSGTTTTS